MYGNTVSLSKNSSSFCILSCAPRSSQNTISVTVTTREEDIHCVVNDAYASLDNPKSRCSDTQLDHVYDTAEVDHKRNGKEQPQYNHICTPIDYNLLLLITLNVNLDVSDRRVEESTDDLELFYDDIVQQTSYLTDKPVV